MGRKNEIVSKSFKVFSDGTVITKDVELFTWEKLDYVEKNGKISFWALTPFEL